MDGSGAVRHIPRDQEDGRACLEHREYPVTPAGELAGDPAHAGQQHLHGPDTDLAEGRPGDIQRVPDEGQAHGGRPQRDPRPCAQAHQGCQQEAHPAGDPSSLHDYRQGMVQPDRQGSVSPSAEAVGHHRPLLPKLEA